MRSGRVATIAVVLLALAGCVASTTPSATTSTRPSTAAATSQSTATTRTPTTTTPTSGPSAGRTQAATATKRWTPAHVVVVIEENHSYRHVIGSPSAPYLNSLVAGGASLGRMYAIRHPSEPNYLALFSGSTHGLQDDSCPHRYGGPTLATQFATAHRRVVGYSEGLPHAGDPTCSTGRYARKHAPWTNFAPTAVGQPLTAWPSEYTKLPDVSFVVPDLLHDMHDGTIAQADTWLEQHLSAYAHWARTHDSLLIVTWDEDDHSQANRIPTVFSGARVRHVVSATRTNLYGLLRTVEWLFGLPGIGAARTAKPITDVWAAG